MNDQNVPVEFLWELICQWQQYSYDRLFFTDLTSRLNQSIEELFVKKASDQCNSYGTDAFLTDLCRSALVTLGLYITTEWYKGAGLGYPLTNNGLEATIQRALWIKCGHTLGERLVRQFLQAVTALIKTGSIVAVVCCFSEMDIDSLLEELDNVDCHNHFNKQEISPVYRSALTSGKLDEELTDECIGTKIDNVCGLLDDLDNSMFDDADDLAVKTTKKKSPKYACDNTDVDIATTKKELKSKYHSSGYEIHRALKENKSKSDISNGVVSSWKINTTSSERSNHQLVSPVSLVTGKVDVYAEPTFGLKLVNPLVSSQFIQTKMVGKQPVAVENIAYHLRCGDKNSDWVFAGAIVFKSGLKTSQKGSQYCMWKISDLKRDLRTVSVYLFSKACSDLWKVAVGTVVAILNASSFNKDEQVSKDDITLTVRSADQVMIWGGSRDYGVCKAKKKNGDNCTSFVNKSACEFCLYHVKSEYNKFSNRRTDLQFSSGGGLGGLRNKVLGKNEVFYGGKSFTALKVPPSENKVSKRDNQLINRLPLNESKKSASLSQSDSRTLALLSNSHDANQSKRQSSDSGKSTKLQVVASHPNESFTSRLHMLKEAGRRMIDSGETTRVTVKPQKNSGLSFATVFSSSKDVASSSAELESRINKHKKLKIETTNNKTHCSGFELFVEGTPTRDADNLKLTRQLLWNKSHEISNIDQLGKTLEVSESNHRSNTVVIKSTLSSSNPTHAVVEIPGNSAVGEKSFSEFGKFDVSFPKEKENTARPSSPLISRDDSGTSRTNANPLQNKTYSISGNIHERKKNINKMNAINLIKKQGGLSKSNPNRVRSDFEKKICLKRRLEEEEEEDNNRSKMAREGETKFVDRKSVLSERFINLMNAKSKHEDLVDLAETIEQQNYFNKLEKKEQLEEKMLNTYKVPCKAVTCLKCKYKWFSASDLCRAEGHPIKVIDTFKRFFKCDNCSNRTVTLEIIPLVNCKNCGSSKWCRAPMIRDKIIKSDNQLCIRGDEQKNLNSLAHNINLNLLVPD